MHYKAFGHKDHHLAQWRGLFRGHGRDVTGFHDVHLEPPVRLDPGRSGGHDRGHHAHRNPRCRATGGSSSSKEWHDEGVVQREVLGPVPYLASVERNLRNYSNQSLAQFAKSHFIK